ncbi:glycosyltransferase family 2 protein [Candidatus Pelagibacter sp.]|nr:glycosyltransferase family 2 protein [Candidatus Pelagibacter sp.]
MSHEYYLKSSIEFFKLNFQKRVNFLKKKFFLFNEISGFINNCIDNSKNIFIFCAGNSILSKSIQSKKIYIKEISKEYHINYNHNNEYVNENIDELLLQCDSVIIADIEHQSNPASNLFRLSKIINNDAKIIVISRNLIWMIIIKILKSIFNFSPKKNNFLPSSYLENLYSSCNLEIIRNEKIIALPIYIPFLTSLINKLFRLPILNLFCLSSITILKTKNKKLTNKKELKVSFIIPCKNEENNIKFFKEKIFLNDKSYEYLFGDDNSIDNTIHEIDKLSRELSDYKIIKYDGPGVCKSENVYKGIDLSSGDIIVIYDADLTVSFKDIEFSIDILKKTNTDFVNCTRMIYPQKYGAMKFANFIGNNFFAYLFSLLFKKKITDTLCGTKIFYKKDWMKIKKNISSWGDKRFMG